MKRNFRICALALWLAVLGCAATVHAQNSSTNRQTPPKGFFANINGARIFYTITGQGEPLVLIHGYPLSGDLFVKQIT